MIGIAFKRAGFAFVVGDGGLKCFHAHYRAVQFFFGQFAEHVNNIFIGYFRGFLQSHAFDDFSQHRRRSNRAGAAESLEFSFFNPAVRTNFQGKFQRIAAGDIADIAGGVRTFYFTHISRMEKVVHHFIIIVPHKAPLI